MGSSDVHIDIFYQYFNRYIDIRVKFLKAIILNIMGSLWVQFRKCSICAPRLGDCVQAYSNVTSLWE